MYIIAGLGNPGRQYEHTRHNAGFEAIDRLADRHRISIENKKFQALCGTGAIDGQKVLLLKPQTYMNLSGESIRAACDFYKIDPEQDLVIMYDDISLAPGHLRIRAKGSAGGHNGIKSIIQHLGTQNFLRVKIGVGEKPAEYDLADYVLGHFAKDEWPVMDEAFKKAGDAAAKLLTEELQTVMNEYNTAKEKKEKKKKPRIVKDADKTAEEKAAEENVAEENTAEGKDTTADLDEK